MPEMHLRLKKNQKFEETGGLEYIYLNELDKVYFQYDMAYEDFKYLPIRIAADKVLLDEALNIAKNPNYDEYQRSLVSMSYKFF